MKVARYIMESYLFVELVRLLTGIILSGNAERHHGAGDQSGSKFFPEVHHFNCVRCPDVMAGNYHLMLNY